MVRCFKLHGFKFLLVQRMALTFRYLWLKNKLKISSFENLHSFKVVQALDLITWLDFLLNTLFLFFSHCAYRHCIAIPIGGFPIGTNSAVYLANFYLFSMSSIFSSISWIILLCFIDCPLFVVLWMTFLFLTFPTLRVLCT